MVPTGSPGAGRPDASHRTGRPAGDRRGLGGAAPVRAAGCVLWRRARSGGPVEIALVHRPRYDDWSHPKGKLKRGEDPLRGAVREVLEETGIGCLPGPELPTVRYPVRGRPKEVRYWAAEADPEDVFVPNREVDRLLWLPPDPARGLLTHHHDRALVDALLTALRAG
ncbi:NUDIX hydrolase [Streptomyces pactum]|uniref:NUDIX hydrolase n=1 Tax=Streptomyces pactum TaxID=68249 RepID=A0ABS0NK94_9ACTN|nr:NUDIX hydrolase [Streptomyces pactum]